MANTTNFGWETPDDTDLVKDGAAAMRTLGNSIDSSFVDLKGGTTGQILSKNSNTDLDYIWINNDQGDITAVTAGTGLTGGGTSGAVTLTNDMATTITAAGDIVVGTGSGTYDNLPIGTTGQVLTADTTVSPYKVKWQTISSTPSFIGCRARQTTGQSISNATDVAVTFDTEDYDTTSFHSTTTNTSRFTIPSGQGGYYFISATLAWPDASAGSRQIKIFKNGTQVSGAQYTVAVNSASASTYTTSTTVLNLSAGDYIEAFGYQSSGGSLSVSNFENSYFQIYFVGA